MRYFTREDIQEALLLVAGLGGIAYVVAQSVR